MSIPETPHAGAPSETSSTTGPQTVFRDDFLARLWLGEDPPQALRAERVGPWEVRALAHGRFALFRHWEDPSQGDAPTAVFEHESLALLAAAILPALSFEAGVRIGSEAVAGADGERAFPIFVGAEVAGHLSVFDDSFVSALSVAFELTQQPHSLALLLQAAGPTALELVGRRLDRALGRERREP